MTALPQPVGRIPSKQRSHHPPAVVEGIGFSFSQHSDSVRNDSQGLWFDVKLLNRRVMLSTQLGLFVSTSTGTTGPSVELPTFSRMAYRDAQRERREQECQWD